MANKSAVDDLPQRLFQAQLAYEGRTGKRLTREMFAEMLEVSQPTVSDWFNGVRTPNLYQCEAIAKALGVEPSWLGFGAGPMLADRPPVKTTQPTQTKIEHRKKGAK